MTYFLSSTQNSLRFGQIIIFGFILMFVSSAIAQPTITGSDNVSVTIQNKSRIVSIGAAVTETIFALDASNHLIAVDESSVYPAETSKLTKVSFTRNLSAEGILSTSPTLILASGAAGPESSIQQIRSTGIPLLKLPADETVQGAIDRVEMLGMVFDKKSQADEIISKMNSDLNKAKLIREQSNYKPVVLFIYARGSTSLLVAGSKTSAKTIIELAGGKNAFNDFEGYKPLTREAVVVADPDVILMMDSGLQSVGGMQGLVDVPGINLTKAAKNQHIYSMDGNYLLGFGPRVGEAVLDLMYLIHPDLEQVKTD